MKALLILVCLFSMSAFAAPQCTGEAQEQIDSYLKQISVEENRIKIVDLEFEIKTVSYNFEDCRVRPIENDRELASL